MESDDDKTRTHVSLTKGTMVSHYRIVEKIVPLVKDTWVRVFDQGHDGVALPDSREDRRRRHG